ncbi:MAG: prepilin-type N-terminal cleavage/methylation domain-containing protein, partial [Phycisphaerales bacterium]|nr:prepilin-type N-terminal cleavage/methylation domain-containing protein [Phycisphaerales bacterium]
MTGRTPSPHGGSRRFMTISGPWTGPGPSILCRIAAQTPQECNDSPAPVESTPGGRSPATGPQQPETRFMTPTTRTPGQTRNARRAAGFSLLELMLVVVIMGIL